MKLKEFESKKVLETVGFPLSLGEVFTHANQIPWFEGPRFFKVQTISNGRGKAGGIEQVEDNNEAKALAKRFLGSTFLGEEITEVALDEVVDIKKEWYLGIMFDTSSRDPVFIFSQKGGVDIEKLQQESPSEIYLEKINYIEGLTDEVLDRVVGRVPDIFQEEFTLCVRQMYEAFCRHDCRMIEVNPLCVTGKGKLVGVDCVVVLDDDAKFRSDFDFGERTMNRKATDREIRAHSIDKDDHRGVAGKTFLDLDGDIAILTSGGGASMTLMDALVEYGGKPANFTEYSGNPPREKVEKLTRIVLDREGLNGLLIAGVIANFTNIAETLQGVLDVLIEVKPAFPIVVRRAGPHDDEAREILMKAKDEHGLDIHYYDETVPLTQSVKIMVELSRKFRLEVGHGNSD